jgi:hypothetical protein
MDLTRPGLGRIEQRATMGERAGRQHAVVDEVRKVTADADPTTRRRQTRRNVLATLVGDQSATTEASEHCVRSKQRHRGHPATQTEDGMQSHTIIDTASPRYGFDPKIAFATTRAGAERRRHVLAAVGSGGSRRRSRWQLIRRLVTRR